MQALGNLPAHCSSMVGAGFVGSGSWCPPSCKVLVHFFYSDRNEPDRLVVPAELHRSLGAIRRGLGATCAVNTTVWARSTILQFLNERDPELGRLYSRISPKFPALLADIARVTLMHRFGGIYHDVSYRFSDASSLCTMLCVLQQYSAVFETHPIELRMRNTNMAASQPGLRIFEDCLLVMKQKLASAIARYERGEMPLAESASTLYDIGSRSIIQLVTGNSTLRLQHHEDLIHGVEVRYRSELLRIMRWPGLRWDRAFKQRVNNANGSAGEVAHWSKLQAALFV